MPRLTRPRLALPALSASFPSLKGLRVLGLRSLPLTLAIVAVLAAIMITAGLVAFVAERVYGAGRDERAAAEAASYAEHSGWLATGDAFGGYIQMLRDAEDPDVASAETPSDARTAALRRLLELNTNRFSGLAVVNLDGALVAATDPSMLDAVASEAYGTVRANRGNANSDIVLLPDGGGAHVDYATILVDPTNGPWGVLVARAEPAQLWQSTLAASVDGGQNVIINRDGQLAAGVPAEVAGSAWSASPFVGGTYRSSVIGQDAVCALAPIARDTQIDHDWNVASCLPAGVVIGGSSSAREVVLLAGLLAVGFGVLGAGALAVVSARFNATPSEGAAPTFESEDAEEAVVEAVEATPPPVYVLSREVADAQTLIEAYEARNARIAGRLRDSVQARLLVASSRVDEGLTLVEDDVALARVMLERASYELDDLNERELRAVGQELHPDLVRLGLPAALRALRKDAEDLIEVDVTADADADSLDEGSERAIEMPRRVAMYRLALDSLRLFADSGLGDCSIVLERRPERLWLAVKGHGDASVVDGAPLKAAAIALEAYGGRYVFERAHDMVEVAVEFVLNGAVGAADEQQDAPQEEDSAEIDESADSESEAA